jgi:signal transduction histidine kinase
VIDSGPGLSAEQRQDALQAFVRLGTGDEYGSGLGLSIVQRVSALLGIGFELLDAPSGRGLEARFTLTPRSSRA